MWPSILWTCSIRECTSTGRKRTHNIDNKRFDRRCYLSVSAWPWLCFCLTRPWFYLWSWWLCQSCVGDMPRKGRNTTDIIAQNPLFTCSLAFASLYAFTPCVILIHNLQQADKTRRPLQLRGRSRNTVMKPAILFQPHSLGWGLSDLIHNLRVSKSWGGGRALSSTSHLLSRACTHVPVQRAADAFTPQNLEWGWNRVSMCVRNGCACVRAPCPRGET